MFGLSDDVEKKPGDVVIRDAGDVTVDGAQDVYVEARAATSGQTTVRKAQDVHVEREGASRPDVYRDLVVTDGRDVTVKGAEDVVVASGSVSGDLTVENAEDVQVADTTETRVEDVEDVYVERGAISRGDVTVEAAQDVILRSDAVDGPVAVDDPEDVLLDPDAVAGRVAESTQSPTEFGSVLDVVHVQDVHVEDGAIDGDVAVGHAEDVLRDGEGD